MEVIPEPRSNISPDISAIRPIDWARTKCAWAFYGCVHKKAPSFSTGLRSLTNWVRLHSRIAAVLTAAHGSFLFLGQLGDQSFGRQHQSCDRGRVLESGAGHLGWIDDTGLHQVFELIGLGVVAEVVVFGTPTCTLQIGLLIIGACPQYVQADYVVVNGVCLPPAILTRANSRS